MNGDINELMNRVLSDPEALNGVMKLAQGLMNGGEGRDGNKSDEQSTGNISEQTTRRSGADIASGDEQTDRAYLSELSDKLKLPQLLTYDENRVKLLSALRPYLGDNRRQLIDYILNAMRVFRLMGSGKGGM